jgi:hypothetical protein
LQQWRRLARTTFSKRLPVFQRQDNLPSYATGPVAYRCPAGRGRRRLKQDHLTASGVHSSAACMFGGCSPALSACLALALGRRSRVHEPRAAEVRLGKDSAAWSAHFCWCSLRGHRCRSSSRNKCRGSLRRSFRLQMSNRVIGENLTAAQAHLLLGEILGRLVSVRRARSTFLLARHATRCQRSALASSLVSNIERQAGGGSARADLPPCMTERRANVLGDDDSRGYHDGRYYPARN